jgi:hypothetical protein
MVGSAAYRPQSRAGASKFLGGILPACSVRRFAFKYAPYSQNKPAMKKLRPLLIAVLTLTAAAQTTPGAAPAAAAAPGAPAAPAAKPKPFSSSDTNAYVKIAESMQYQLHLSLTLRGKFKDTNPDLVSLGSRVHKEMTDLWTPGVNLAQQRGVDNKKIPQALSKNDKAAVAKVGTIKDEKKWTVAYFELFAKESKKAAADAEKIVKAVQDAELKAFVEKAAALLKSESETIEAKYKELKSGK